MKIIYISVILIVLVSSDVRAQNSDSTKSAHKKSVTFTYLYATETSFISPREAGLIKIFYGVGDTEENFFKTHTFNLNYALSEKYQVGLALKYGNNFYRSSSERGNELDNGDRDYNSYIGIGVSGQIQLLKLGSKENEYPFRVTNTVSLQYVQFDGIEAQGNFNSRTQKEVELKGLFTETGVLVSYLFNDSTSAIRVFYQPLNFQVGTYGFAFQYNGFGLTIKF